MDGVLNFPLYYTLRRYNGFILSMYFTKFKCANRVYNEGFSMTYLRDNLELEQQTYSNIQYNAPFIDNHDQPRFLSMTPNLEMLKSALSVMFFAEGIPIVYYGLYQTLHMGY